MTPEQVMEREVRLFDGPGYSVEMIDSEVLEGGVACVLYDVRAPYGVTRRFAVGVDGRVLTSNIVGAGD